MSRSREPMPRELVATKALELGDREILTNRLLESYNVHIFILKIVDQLAPPALLPEPPHVPNKCENIHMETISGLVPLRGTDRALLEVEGWDVA